MYLCFSAAMRPGGAFTHIHLLDEKGAEIRHALLEEEVWDRDTARLTVLFDPARIKRGEASRLEPGPNLVEGHSYTLAIDRDWKDAAGENLAEGSRKSFHVVQADHVSLEPSTWHITTPKPGTRDALLVDFPKPLDYALVLRSLSVKGVSGAATLDRGETEWRFVPNSPWKSGDNRLWVDRGLEDVAGNRIYRPFESNTHGAIATGDRPPAGTVEVRFHIDPQ